MERRKNDNGIKEEIKNVGIKIDNHFEKFYKSFSEHEKMEISLIKSGEERLNKLDDMMRELKENHHTVIKSIIKRINIFSVVSMASLIISIIVGIIQWLNLAH